MTGRRGYGFMNNLPPGCTAAEIDALCPEECTECEQAVDECECEEHVDPPDPEDGFYGREPNGWEP